MKKQTKQTKKMKSDKIRQMFLKMKHDRRFNIALGILIPILVLAGCLILPDLYFRKQDEKNFQSTNKHNLEAVNLTISSNISFQDKLLLISRPDDYSLVNLNFDYNDAYSFNDVRNMCVDELDKMLGDLNLPFFTDGIYEAVIDKYLVSCNDNPQLNFIIWRISIRYFGCPMEVLLDYDTSTILYFRLDLRTSTNTWHDAESFHNLPYYSIAIIPFLDFLEADTSDNTEHLNTMDSAFQDMIAEYYGFDAGLIDIVQAEQDGKEPDSTGSGNSYSDSIMENYEYTSTDYLFSYTLSGKGSSADSGQYYRIEENNLHLSFNAYSYSE